VYNQIWLDFVADDHQFGYSQYKIKPIMITVTRIIIILCFKILLQKTFASLVEMISKHWNREYWTRIGMKEQGFAGEKCENLT
jgi:hypothetical protein